MGRQQPREEGPRGYLEALDAVMRIPCDDTSSPLFEYRLTHREHEILGYLARGRSAKYIATHLVLSENTVWGHIKRIYNKMDCHSKQELLSLVDELRRDF